MLKGLHSGVQSKVDYIKWEHPDNVSTDTMLSLMKEVEAGWLMFMYDYIQGSLDLHVCINGVE